jgi:hypothetical protein
MVMLCKGCRSVSLKPTKLVLHFSDFSTNFKDFSKALDIVAKKLSYRSLQLGPWVYNYAPVIHNHALAGGASLPVAIHGRGLSTCGTGVRLYSPRSDWRRLLDLSWLRQAAVAWPRRRGRLSSKPREHRCNGGE